MEYVSFLTICTESDAAFFSKDRNHLPLCRKQYLPEEAEKILREAEKWEILYKWSRGSDYGYDQRSDEKGSHTEMIQAECVLVENGCFAGVVMRSEGTAFNKRTEAFNDLTAALIRDYHGEPLLCASGGTSFSSDDHSSWDIYRYYLQPKSTMDRAVLDVSN